MSERIKTYEVTHKTGDDSKIKANCYLRVGDEYQFFDDKMNVITSVLVSNVIAIRVLEAASGK